MAWGNKKYCVSCNRWKEPADFNQYPPEIAGIDGWCAKCVGKKRSISPLDEQIFRMVHHDFEALSFGDAAWELATSDSLEDITKARKIISEALARIAVVDKKYRLSLLPVLTPLEADCCEAYMSAYTTHAAVAKHLSVRYDKTLSANAVGKAIERAEEKGFYLIPKHFRNPGEPSKRMVRWNDKLMSFAVWSPEAWHGPEKGFVSCRVLRQF